MTPSERLSVILEFRTDTDDPITEDHVHSLLLTHPVKGIFINGNIAHDELANFLDFCHPTPVPIALVNHSRDLYYRLHEHQSNICEGHTVQPEIMGTLFIFAGPWLIHGSIDAYYPTHLNDDVFNDLWKLLPTPGREVREQNSVGHDERKVLRNLMALEAPELFPGCTVLAYLHKRRELERRGFAVFFIGVALAAIGILALTGGATLAGQVLAGLGARRLTTTQNRGGVRTDFYEFYWAHLMKGTSLNHIFGWARRLLWRNPNTLLKQLVPAWFLLIGIIAIVLFFTVQAFLPAPSRIVAVPAWVMGLFGVASAWLVVPLLKRVIGDAARYLDPTPGNVGRRQAIRTAGVDVLVKLHAADEYDRIVIVGHSLGSVIGYDILAHAWALYNEQEKARGEHAALDRIEAFVASGATDTTAYRMLQRDLHQELKSRGDPWLVTDFVTLGSPLAHAQILLAKDEDDLGQKQQDRELPTCPPVLENDKFSYPANRQNRDLHHAAVFGPTRWTNLYFPAKHLIYGDLIGGPIGPLFGAGVRDCMVETNLRGGLFSHTLYWTSGEPAPSSHIVALRDALNLLET